MDISEREIFTFTWQIENFTFCPHQVEEGLRSPSFTVDFMNGNEYELCIYPRGVREHENHVAIYLFLNAGTYSQKFGFAFTLLSLTGKEIKKTIESHLFEKCNGRGFHSFCTVQDILNITNGHLRNDTLTLKYEMWKITDGDNDGDRSNNVDDGIATLESLNQMPTTSVEDGILNLQTQFDCNESKSVTRINVFKKSAVWSIKKFCELRPSKILFPTIHTTMPSFLLVLYLTGGNSDHQRVQIVIERISPRNKKIYFVKCQISVLSAMKRIRFVKENEHFFDADTKNDVWVFPQFIDLKKLEEKKDLAANSDIMYLRFDFAVTTRANLSHFHKRDFLFSNRIPIPNRNSSVVSMFKQMYNSEEFCDVVLRSGSRELKAHKIVLAAHSPVFRAMFQNDTIEKKSGLVDITDIDGNTLRSMLDFMYGDDLNITEYEEAENLYSAADKYQIQPLKCLSSCFMKSSLSISSVVSVIIVADQHQDEELMIEAKNFIRFNIAEVFHSEAWAEFMQSNLKLASAIMFNLLKDFQI